LFPLEEQGIEKEGNVVSNLILGEEDKHDGSPSTSFSDLSLSNFGGQGKVVSRVVNICGADPDLRLHHVSPTPSSSHFYLFQSFSFTCGCGATGYLAHSNASFVLYILLFKIYI